MLDFDADLTDMSSDIDKLSGLISDLRLEIDSPSTILIKFQQNIESLSKQLCSTDDSIMCHLVKILSEGIESITDESRNLTENELSFLDKIPTILYEYIELPKSKIPDAHFLTHVKNSQWTRKITDDEELYCLDKLTRKRTDLSSSPVPVEIVNDVQIIESSEIENDVSNSDCDPEVIDLSDFIESNSKDVCDFDSHSDEFNLNKFIEENDTFVNQDKESFCPDDAAPLMLSEDRQELVNIVIQEVDELQNVVATNINESINIKSLLIDTAEQIETVSNAVELIELNGLSLATRIMSCNIHVLALNDDNPSEDVISYINSWSSVVLHYLNNIADNNASMSIIDYMKCQYWPEALCEATESMLYSQLLHPEFTEEVSDTRQDQAKPEDMSIKLPDNVNQELLDGLLQDLPVQAEEFSSSIENLLNHQDITYLESAQRIAHTLKGAGNVVGVSGIANLTHHVEDILEIQAKAQKIPSSELLITLTDVADCLETISEALLGISDEPDNALDVYQNVLDWANKLDREGATEFDINSLQKSTTNPLSVPASISEQKKSTTAPSHKENMLRVPVKLADDLLRLAGENMISTSQMQEYIKVIRSRYKSMKVHNQLLQQLSFQLEHIVDIRGLTSHNDYSDFDSVEFDSLELDQYHELHTMSRRLVELSADSIEMSQVLEEDLAKLQGLVINQDQLQKENEELILRTRMIPSRTIAARLKRGIKQVCRLTGKNVEFSIIDNDTYMDSEVLNSMIEPLMHLLRNSIDHGIEDTKTRELNNKSTTGNIELSFKRKGDKILIIINDDGQGLDLEKIRNKAISSGIVADVTDITESNLLQYILQPGFSTSEKLSHISGRGIGLDVVNEKVRELKGTLDVQSVAGKGCTFNVTLPVSSFSTHSLMVRVRNSIYAISNRGIEEILYPGLGEQQQVGEDIMFRFNDQLYPTKSIEQLLNIPEDRRTEERSTNPVILLKDDLGHTTAVLVQEVVDSRDVVVKPLGPYLPKIRGVIGATVLGDGSISSVIDLPELLATSSLNNPIQYENTLNPLVDVKSLPYVLVVDDSLSARKSLAQFVEDLGLEVRTARDGMEAVTLIDVNPPGLVLVDMEMPRMNGLELTSHIRANMDTKSLPVIMITSRSTDKHRKIALEKGVDHYMVKPFAEDELAVQINNILKIA